MLRERKKYRQPNYIMLKRLWIATSALWVAFFQWLARLDRHEPDSHNMAILWAFAYPAVSDFGFRALRWIILGARRDLCRRLHPALGAIRAATPHYTSSLNKVRPPSEIRKPYTAIAAISR